MRLVQQLAEPRSDRSEVENGARREPTAEHKEFGVEGVGQIGETHREPSSEVVDDGESIRIAIERGPLHVLSPHIGRIPSGA